MSTNETLTEQQRQAQIMAQFTQLAQRYNPHQQFPHTLQQPQQGEQPQPHQQQAPMYSQMTPADVFFSHGSLHPVTPDFCCRLCCLSFSSQHLLLQHVLQVHPEMCVPPLLASSFPRATGSNESPGTTNANGNGNGDTESPPQNDSKANTNASIYNPFYVMAQQQQQHQQQQLQQGYTSLWNAFTNMAPHPLQPPPQLQPLPQDKSVNNNGTAVPAIPSPMNYTPAPTSTPAPEPSPAPTPAPAPAPSPTTKPSVLVKDKDTFSCDICNVTCDTQHTLDVHLGGAKHRKRAKIHEELRKLLQPPNDTLIVQNEQGWKCKLCPTIAMKGTNEVIQHIESTRHSRALSTFLSSNSHNFSAHVADQGNGNVTSTATAAPAQTSSDNLQQLQQLHQPQQQSPQQMLQHTVPLLHSVPLPAAQTLQHQPPPPPQLYQQQQLQQQQQQNVTKIKPAIVKKSSSPTGQAAVSCAVAVASAATSLSPSSSKSSFASSGEHNAPSSVGSSSLACELCSVSCNSLSAFNSHMGSNKHKRRLLNSKNSDSTPLQQHIQKVPSEKHQQIFKCELCNIEVCGRANLATHNNGRAHNKKLRAQQVEKQNGIQQQQGPAQQTAGTVSNGQPQSQGQATQPTPTSQGQATQPTPTSQNSQGGPAVHHMSPHLSTGVNAQNGNTVAAANVPSSSPASSATPTSVAINQQQQGKEPGTEAARKPNDERPATSQQGTSNSAEQKGDERNGCKMSSTGVTNVTQ